MILNIRTDQAESFVALSDGQKMLVEEKWQAHRELSDTLLKKIEDLLNTQSKNWQDITGVNVYKGPGSFTGLRIGITVANTLSESLRVAVVGSNGGTWMEHGIERLLLGQDDKIVMPIYGGEANITTPRK